MSTEILQLIEKCGQPLAMDWNDDEGRGWEVHKYGKGFDHRPVARGKTLEAALANLVRLL